MKLSEIKDLMLTRKAEYFENDINPYGKIVVLIRPVTENEKMNEKKDESKWESEIDSFEFKNVIFSNLKIKAQYESIEDVGKDEDEEDLTFWFRIPRADFNDFLVEESVLMRRGIYKMENDYTFMYKNKESSLHRLLLKIVCVTKDFVYFENAENIRLFLDCHRGDFRGEA